METYDRTVIEHIREMRKIKHISYQKIYDRLENNGHYISMATIRRVFTADLDTVNFRYDYTIKPIADLLLSEETSESMQIYNFIKHLKREIDSFYEYLSQEKAHEI